METFTMKIEISAQRLAREVQEEFSRAYPYLRIEFVKRAEGSRRFALSNAPAQPALEDSQEEPAENGTGGKERALRENARLAAQVLLWDTFGVSDSMSINELEILLQYQFGLPVQILRKSGNLWMETRMNRHWTLRQQNDHGEALSV